MFAQLWKKNNYINLFRKIVIFFVFINAIIFSSAYSMQNFDVHLPPIFVLKKNNTTIYLLATVHDAPLSWIKTPIIDLLTKADMLLIEHENKNIPYYIHNTPTDIEVKKYCLLKEKFPLNTDIVQKCMALQFQVSKKENKNSLQSVLQQSQHKSIKTLIEHPLNLLSATKQTLSLDDDRSLVFDFTEILNYELWMADLVLACHLSLKVMNLTKRGMEKELLEHFRLEGKPIYYLETDEDISTIMRAHEQSQSAQLDQIINNLTTILELTQAEKGNEQVNISKIIKSYIDHSSFNIKFLMFNQNHPISVAERNHNWVKNIKIHANTQTTILIAVGNGHLSGSKGLLSLLFKEGFKIAVLDNSTQMLDIPQDIMRTLMGEID